MRRDEHLLYLLEQPQTPFNDPSAPRDWKEWYHYVLIDPRTGTRILANVSCSGVPGSGQIIATVIITLAPGAGETRARTFGYSSDVEWRGGMVREAPFRMTTPDVEFEVTGADSRFVSRDRYRQIEIEITGHASAMPVLIPEMSPFGSGFIGWGLVPGVRVDGRAVLGDRVVHIDEHWFCYHDHNYGRFRWGEDIGWIWFVAALRTRSGRAFTLVLHRGNNRDQTRCGAPFLFVYEGDALRKVFMGDAVGLDWQWSAERRLPARLPGAMATLFAGRTLRLPTGLSVDAADERDSLSLRLLGDSNAELVLPDDRDRQYTFIEECTGAATMQYHHAGARHEATGYFYAEFVH